MSDRSRSSDKHKESESSSHHHSSRSSEGTHRSRRNRSRSSIASTSHHPTDTPGSSFSFDRDLFYTDTRGDFDALTYGQDQSRVPKYQRNARSLGAVGAASSTSALETLNISAEATPGSPDAALRPSTMTTLQSAEDFIGIDDPFDPNLPYVKRDPRYEQVGGGPNDQASSHKLAASSTSAILNMLKRDSLKDRPTGLQDLPVELLQRILVLSRSDSFPLTCRHIRQACLGASITDKVDYIMNRWMDRYIAYLTTTPCESRRRGISDRAHKACKQQAALISSIWRERDPLWLDFASAIPHRECDRDAVRWGGLGIITSAAKFGICPLAVLERVVQDATASALPRGFLTTDLPSHMQACTTEQRCDVATSWDRNFPEGDPNPELPKRLFRRIDHFEYADVDTHVDADDTHQNIVSASEEPPRKRRRKRNRTAASTSATDVESNASTSERKQADSAYPVWLAQLLSSLARPSPPDTNDIKERVGPVPGVQELELIVAMLFRYGALASSHDGFPLAMAVHRRAYSLVHLLLLFGAHPECKDALAVQIAIQNGFIDILKLLVTGPCIDVDRQAFLPFHDAYRPLLQLGSPEFELDNTHLRLAIQSRQWEIVDYIWHEKGVSPDMACLRLIEKLKK